MNNVAVAAAHGKFTWFQFMSYILDLELLAHIKHGIKRVVIFDIDLHHGANDYRNFKDGETQYIPYRKWYPIDSMADKRGDIS